MLLGVDEAGVGTLAGPIVIAAVGFKDASCIPKSVRDSKKLSVEQRDRIVDEIHATCSWKSIHFGSNVLIDEVGNIWKVWTRLMQTIASEIHALGRSEIATVDGNRLVPGAECFKYVVGADATIPEVSAASVLAKYAQTSMMEIFHETYPQFGFGSHHGYPTTIHKRALAEYGPCPIHRMCYRPVREAAQRRPK
jgi:ribonuclease HII